MQDVAIRQISDERSALLAFLAGVDGPGWELPTVCTGWSVKDVLAHLVEGEINVGKIYRGEIREQGYVDPEEGIAKWRALPGEAVRASLWQHGVATQRVLDAMGGEVWRTPIKAFGCTEVRHLVRLHLFDLVVHGHDLTDALGADPIWGDRLGAVVEFVLRAAPWTLTRLHVAPEGALAVRADGVAKTIDGRGGAWALTDAEAPATLHIEREDLVLLTTGRRGREEVLLRAKVGGDEELAARILAAWRVV